ncbi:MAG: Kelch repeat-containing protein [Anaerolineales bacterium]
MSHSHHLSFIASVLALSACAQATPVVTYHDELVPGLAMREPRAAHTATLLADGRVLLAGGFKDDGHGDELALASAELYDPQTDTFMLAGAMAEPRNGHTATRLPDGSVLLVGGWGDDVRLSTTELYDPTSGTFTAAGALVTRRANHTATLLNDGRVLLAGGSQTRNVLVPNAEVYEPTSGVFTAIAALGEPREGNTATQLSDGRVLLAGGTAENDRVLASAEIFEPATNTFTRVGDLTTARRKHAAILLPDGRVLIIGGSDDRDWRGKYISTELFDPATQTFAPGPDLSNERFKLADATVLLPDGRVLVSGGSPWLELFNAGRFSVGDSLDAAYYFSTATLLADGRVLIAGGYDQDIIATAQTWVFR